MNNEELEKRIDAVETEVETMIECRKILEKDHDRRFQEVWEKLDYLVHYVKKFRAKLNL